MRRKLKVHNKLTGIGRQRKNPHAREPKFANSTIHAKNIPNNVNIARVLPFVDAANANENTIILRNQSDATFDVISYADIDGIPLTNIDEFNHDKLNSSVNTIPNINAKYAGLNSSNTSSAYYYVINTQKVESREKVTKELVYMNAARFSLEQLMNT